MSKYRCFTSCLTMYVMSLALTGCACCVSKPISSLPFTINESGSYHLTGNLQSASDGIVIEADDVTIDQKGFALTGAGTGNGVVMEARNNVTIQNGTVRGFDRGIYEKEHSGQGHRIINMRAIGNAQDGIFLRGGNNAIVDCVAGENGASGMFASLSSLIKNNVAYDNGERGIYTGAGNVIIHNVCRNNQYIGIQTSTSTVSYNTVTVNKAGGIAAFYSVISNNTVERNLSTGITGGGGSTVVNNSVRFNRRTGISCGSGCTVVGNSVGLNNQDEIGGRLIAGIVAGGNCIVKGNSVFANKLINILMKGGGSAVEENLVTNSDFGIRFRDPGNFFANNRARGNTNSYSNTTGNTDGGGNASY